MSVILEPYTKKLTTAGGLLFPLKLENTSNNSLSLAKSREDVSFLMVGGQQLKNILTATGLALRSWKRQPIWTVTSEFNLEKWNFSSKLNAFPGMRFSGPLWS